MKPQFPGEFEWFCIGLDVALTRDSSKPKTPEEAQKKFEAAVYESLSGYNFEGLISLRDVLGKILNDENPALRLESLWLSFKPTRVFFDRLDSKDPNTAYLSIFKKVMEILETEIASATRSRS